MRNHLVFLLRRSESSMGHHLTRRSKVFVSGIQPTGNLHIGNYLGFIHSFIKLQNDPEVDQRILSVADLHSITMGYFSPEQMRTQILRTTAILLACGVDPDKTVLLQQSQLPEHTQLAWIIGTSQTVTALKRLPQYKDKSKKISNVPIGLLSYPVLQAADVLIYKGTHVLVGEDQNHHLKVLRHLAEVFNLQFKCEHFPIPGRVFSKSPRIKSLKDASKKMSKSDPNGWSRIDITDSKDVILEKCMKAQTDSEPSIIFDPEKRPAVSSLVTIYASFSSQTPEEVVMECAWRDKVQFKKRLAEVIDSKLTPIREEYEELISNEDRIWEMLAEGSERARSIARKNLNETKEIVGFCRNNS